MPGIQKLSHKHIAIMDFMLANPTIPMGVVASEFGVSAPWLSTIVWSDAFQYELIQKAETMFEDSVLMPLGDKIKALAHRTLDKLQEQVETSNDLRTLADIGNKTLDRLGYTANTPAPANGTTHNTQVININGVSKESLDTARGLIGSRPIPIEHKEPDTLEHTTSSQEALTTDLGRVAPTPPKVHTKGPPESSTVERNQA